MITAGEKAAIRVIRSLAHSACLLMATTAIAQIHSEANETPASTDPTAARTDHATPNRSTNFPPAGLRDLLSGMAIGGAVAVIAWAAIHWLGRRKRAQPEVDRSRPVSPAHSISEAEEQRRLGARREMLAQMEIAEATPDPDPPSSQEQAPHNPPAGDVQLREERTALLGAESPSSPGGNGLAQRQGPTGDRDVDSAPPVESLLKEWDHALRLGDLDACRRTMTALAGRIEAPTTEHLREETERISQLLEVSLRERFGTCVREQDYRGALAVGSQIKRQLPESSIANDFDRIHPYLLRRIGRSPS